ncbi:hypothetical protein ADUPG1_006751 [Aduncisulcus paluster]|uniref:Methyltransferase domain-containing protein n=1 Tax=Aduncisulcus paluster TaxID=2918883 RepID=A0ABQ5KMB2_9EUKA|nr:hypothetical protein ADUPG1_006751 [Aduncisulcus paluster]
MWIDSWVDPCSFCALPSRKYCFIGKRRTFACIEKEKSEESKDESVPSISMHMSIKKESQVKYFAPLLISISKYFPRCLFVDVGAGKGYLSLTLASNGLDVVCVECSESNIKALRARAVKMGMEDVIEKEKLSCVLVSTVMAATTTTLSAISSCAGKGYLSLTLASNGLDVVCVECSESNIKALRARAVKMGMEDVIEKEKLSCVVKWVAGAEDMDSSISSAWFKTVDRYSGELDAPIERSILSDLEDLQCILIGLHPCGDLGVDMGSGFASNAHCSVLCYAPCCFHKTIRNSFPHVLSFSSSRPERDLVSSSSLHSFLPRSLKESSAISEEAGKYRRVLGIANSMIHFPSLDQLVLHSLHSCVRSGSKLMKNEWKLHSDGSDSTFEQIDRVFELVERFKRVNINRSFHKLSEQSDLLNILSVDLHSSVSKDTIISFLTACVNIAMKFVVILSDLFQYELEKKEKEEEGEEETDRSHFTPILTMFIRICTGINSKILNICEILKDRKFISSLCLPFPVYPIPEGSTNGKNEWKLGFEEYKSHLHRIISDIVIQYNDYDQHSVQIEEKKFHDMTKKEKAERKKRLQKVSMLEKDGKIVITPEFSSFVKQFNLIPNSESSLSCSRSVDLLSPILFELSNSIVHFALLTPLAKLHSLATGVFARPCEMFVLADRCLDIITQCKKNGYPDAGAVILPIIPEDVSPRCNIVMAWKDVRGKKVIQKYCKKEGWDVNFEIE